MSNDSAQRSNRHSITEQFPTLGNWVARMSKKQTAKTKSKLQSMGNVPFVPAETASRVSGDFCAELIVALARESLRRIQNSLT